jgi:hypothetical protein
MSNNQQPKLLGFDRQRWERRKQELRARLAKEISEASRTHKLRESKRGAGGI